MNRGIHPALAFAKQVEGWSPGEFSQVDKWRETDPLSREHIPMGMEYLALNDPVSTAISQQEEGIRGFWHAVLPVLFWLCPENSEWGRQGKPVRPASRRVAKHQRLIPPDKPVQIFAGVRAGSALRQAPRAPEAITAGTVTPHPIGACAPCQKSPLAKLLEGQTHSGGGEKHVAEMEAITNR